MYHPKTTLTSNKKGAALLVALWVLIILSLIVGSFAFEVKLESMLVSYKRKKFFAETMALSGVEYARAILDQQKNAKELEIADMPEDEDNFMMAALHIKRGIRIERTKEMNQDEGEFTIVIEPVEGKININTMNREDWLDIFEMANVPSTEWDTMIDCLVDWTDDGDLHQLNGAESDDSFYQERGYPVKNGPLDSVEELLLIKNWGPEILYGKKADEDGEEIFGIDKLITVWGDGRLNLNAASVDAMRAAGLTDDEIANITEDRAGADGVNNTLDDGLPDGYLAGDSRFKLQTSFVKVTSTGAMFGNQYQVDCVLLQKSDGAVVVYWNEGPVRNNANTRKNISDTETY